VRLNLRDNMRDFAVLFGFVRHVAATAAAYYAGGGRADVA